MKLNFFLLVDCVVALQKFDLFPKFDFFGKVELLIARRASEVRLCRKSRTSY